MENATKNNNNLKNFFLFFSNSVLDSPIKVISSSFLIFDDKVLKTVDYRSLRSQNRKSDNPKQKRLYCSLHHEDDKRDLLYA